MSESKVALITGGNRGIGFESGRQLAEAGFEVILGSRELEAGQEAAAKLRGSGLNVSAVQLDVTKPDSIAQCRTELNTRNVHVDVLINNAGAWLITPMTKVSEEEFLQCLDINLIGAWRMVQAFLPDMQQRDYGRIVNVTSGSGQMSQPGGPGPGSYGIAKAALNALTLELASEINGNIKINAADPGWTATRMGGASAPRKPEQAAENIAWLATLADDGPTGGLFLDKQQLEW